MARRQWLVAALCVASMGAVGCGSSEKKPQRPKAEVQEEPNDDDILIPEEKFEEIRRTFERKANHVARCFPEAVLAGELDKNDRIKVTVGLVIQPDGSPADVEVIGSSKRSAVVEKCIVKAVSRWTFTTLPKPLRYSNGFTLQDF